MHPNLSIVNEAVHQCLDKRQMLVIHGHQLHTSSVPGWVQTVGTFMYDVLAGLSGVVDRAARRVALSPPQLLHRLKLRLPGALEYLRATREAAVDEARESGFDGVVYGHIHRPSASRLGEHPSWWWVYNTGDWVENCTALVEHTNGIFEIVRG